jgi:hypothetical protein
MTYRFLVRIEIANVTLCRRIVSELTVKLIVGFCDAERTLVDLIVAPLKVRDIVRLNDILLERSCIWG